ncbi:hypothetical protein X798_00619 [Onchocerca flexuosa]|uniref:Uncharacterized protein n=1 Tax=Onchocerca flexuosa TaxID=387005 RepID=A0A238C500_9BILA|nr:hypothetical protein X798_00619 [Onchocerca flexuosa]
MDSLTLNNNKNSGSSIDHLIYLRKSFERSGTIVHQRNNRNDQWMNDDDNYPLEYNTIYNYLFDNRLTSKAYFTILRCCNTAAGVAYGIRPFPLLFIALCPIVTLLNKAIVIS